ncbi:hypothetical protein QVD17_27842 [Tagetes erecta]|uniref:Uncharacterized protein n=1 Tax=Tagetes erecta TaxID=13708 RepID=A0AAD8NS51_TARER|nr:hypothetical protein QVD17_27842 [Tagetes erecta]
MATDRFRFALTSVSYAIKFVTNNQSFQKQTEPNYFYKPAEPIYEERLEESVEFETVLKMWQWFGKWLLSTLAYNEKHWVLILLQHHPTHKTWKGHILIHVKVEVVVESR